MTNVLKKIILIEEHPNRKYTITEHRKNEEIYTTCHPDIQEAIKLTLSKLAIVDTKIRVPVHIKWKWADSYKFSVSQINPFTSNSPSPMTVTGNHRKAHDVVQKIIVLESRPFPWCQWSPWCIGCPGRIRCKWRIWHRWCTVEELGNGTRWNAKTFPNIGSALQSLFLNADAWIIVRLEWSNGEGYEFEISSIDHIP